MRRRLLTRWGARIAAAATITGSGPISKPCPTPGRENTEFAHRVSQASRRNVPCWSGISQTLVVRLHLG
jgi:hypothetical protein